ARTREAPPREVYFAERQRIFMTLLPPEPMRGIRELLTALDEAGIPAAIASTSSARWVVPEAERIGVRGFFQAIVTGDEVRKRKPAPDVYLEAARRLGVDPQDVIAIEDSGPGVAAARAAGMTVVAIPHWLTKTHDLRGAHFQVADAGLLSVDRLRWLVAKMADGYSPTAIPPSHFARMDPWTMMDRPRRRHQGRRGRTRARSISSARSLTKTSPAARTTAG